jgi:hypothetical protein
VPDFEIETYKVSSYLQRFTGETRRSRVLQMTGPVLSQGIQNFASFNFSSSYDGVWDDPIAGFLSDGGTPSLFVLGWFPVAEFPYYYDILRSERPVHVTYVFRNDGATYGYLRMVGLGTSHEEIGEGPSDSEQAISEMMAARLRAIRRPLVPMPTREDLPDQGGQE